MPGKIAQNFSDRITKFSRMGQTREQEEAIRLAFSSCPPRIFPNWPTNEDRDDVLRMLKSLATPSQKRNYNVSGGAIWVPLHSERDGAESKKMLRDWMRNVSNLLKEGKLEVWKSPYLRSSTLRTEVAKMLTSLAANDESLQLEGKYIRIEGVNNFPLEILHELVSVTQKFLDQAVIEVA